MVWKADIYTQFPRHGTKVLDNWQLAMLPQSEHYEFNPRLVHDNLSVLLWVIWISLWRGIKLTPKSVYIVWARYSYQYYKILPINQLYLYHGFPNFTESVHVCMHTHTCVGSHMLTTNPFVYNSSQYILFSSSLYRIVPLWPEFAGNRCIPLTRCQYCEALFLCC